MNDSNRRRLVRFCLLRQHLCPICGNLIYYSNKDNAYKCKNEDCNFKEIRVDDTIKTEKNKNYNSVNNQLI